jgi:hypothetical protein
MLNKADIKKLMLNKQENKQQLEELLNVIKWDIRNVNRKDKEGDFGCSLLLGIIWLK